MPDGYDTGHPFQDWWHRVSDGWNDFTGRLNDYFNQSQVGNSATATLGEGIASGDVVPEELPGQVADVVSQSVNGTSAKTGTNIDLSSILGSSAYAASPALQSYYEMYLKTGNEAYLEKLIDNAFSLENVASARDYDKMMSDTGVSRMIADIEKAGYNPWLALNSGISSASSGSSVMASTSGISGTNQDVSSTNNLRSNSTQVVGNVLKFALMIALFALSSGKALPVK